MARLRIDSFAMAWKPSTNQGTVKLRFQDGQTKSFEADGHDFAALSAILREKETYFDEATETIITNWESPGIE